MAVPHIAAWTNSAFVAILAFIVANEHLLKINNPSDYEKFQSSIVRQFSLSELKAFEKLYSGLTGCRTSTFRIMKEQASAPFSSDEIFESISSSFGGDFPPEFRAFLKSARLTEFGLRPVISNELLMDPEITTEFELPNGGRLVFDIGDFDVPVMLNYFKLDHEWVRPTFLIPSVRGGVGRRRATRILSIEVVPNTENATFTFFIVTEDEFIAQEIETSTGKRMSDYSPFFWPHLMRDQETDNGGEGSK